MTIVAEEVTLPAEAATTSAEAPVEASNSQPFLPRDCETLEEAGLPEALVAALVFKHLLAKGSDSGRGIARDLCVPGKPLVELLADLKNQQLVVYSGSANMGDFSYTLTESGRERAKRHLDECAYCGPAPVPLGRYVESVHAQTIECERPNADQLRAAFSDLLINERTLCRLGPAINSGRGLFLYGRPGNGKTSIAERVTRCFGTHVWIPKALYVEGEIIPLYDPQCHNVVGGSDRPSIVKGQQHDPRWVKIERPTIVVGGELTLDALDLQYNEYTRITEPPLQLKSNNGTLVIDDFGRQRADPFALLNRWIVPLEKRYDYLMLHNGKKLQVPFDQLIVFSTNLEPKELVDDAFLRRIPYKIDVSDPTEFEFRKLLRMTAEQFGIEYDETAVDYLIHEHYGDNRRPFRCCHPRDLLLQLVNQARYFERPPAMTVEGFELACETYFTVM
jgi:predicted ATPase with chaperone activity